MALRTPAFNDAKSYGFEWLRALLEVDCQEGVINAGDLKVTAAAAGGQRVDIAAGLALIKGDSGVAGTGLSQGLFLVSNDAAVANAVTLNASDVTNPRLDQIVLRVRDSSDLGSGADDALFEVVQGVATAGATLDNRNGAAALPNDRLRLADVLVPAGSSAVTAGNVRDRRPWGRGAYRRILRTSNASAGNDYSTTSTGLLAADVDSVNIRPRIECSGVPLRIRLLANIINVTAGASGVFGFGIDGLTGANNVPADGTMVGNQMNVTLGGSPGQISADYGIDYVPTPGSHIFSVLWGVANVASTMNMYARTTIPAMLIVEEIVRQNADNT